MGTISKLNGNKKADLVVLATLGKPKNTVAMVEKENMFYFKGHVGKNSAGNQP